MSRAAVAIASSAAHANARSVDADLERQLERLGRRVGSGPSLRPGRNHVAFLVMLVVGIWVVAVFGRALTDLNQATQRQQSVAAESAALELRLAADRRELALVQTDAFQALQARAYGLGAPGERVFSLPSDAPAAAAIVPLGQSAPADVEEAPLDAWLALLFGR